MQFMKTLVHDAEQQVAEVIAGQLREQNHVLWLVSGGSNVSSQAHIMERVQAQCQDMLHNLTILPMDERYGPKGHANSNTEQLRQAGFTAGNANWCDVLAQNKPFAATVSSYTDAAETLFAQATSIIGTFGIGTDGHTAGVLPHSPALYDNETAVVGYSADPYERMTLTPAWLVRCQAAYVFAFGEAKHAVLQDLAQNRHSLETMPAKLLWDIPACNVYNEYIGE